MNFHGGQAFEIQFKTSKPRITFISESKMKIDVVDGDDAGFSDTVEYQAIRVREELILLSWRDRTGCASSHVLDFAFGQSFAVVTPAKGELVRLKGRIAWLRQ